MLTALPEDNVLAEARNLRNMVTAQTPLLGDENTPLHTTGALGTGFEGATPQHQISFTPNPLATPYRAADPSTVGSTPRESGQAGATPLRTPMRDSLSINPENPSSVVQTPRENRMRESASKRALRTGFMNLPKPENNFELMVPEDEEDETAQGPMKEEDAAERDAKLRRAREEEERKALARRSQAIKLGLPRPTNVEVEQLFRDLQLDDGDLPPDLVPAQRLVDAELVQLLHHDSLTHPLPGTSHPGGTKSSYQMPRDEDIDAARLAIQRELAGSLGFPDANEEQARQGVAALTKSEEVEETFGWPSIRSRLAFDAKQRRYVDPASLSPEDRIEGYSTLLNESRDLMSREAGKISKAEKKLNVTLGGYQLRSKTLVHKVADLFGELQRGHMDYESFSRLRINENAAGPARVESLREEVNKLTWRERMLQDRYAELVSERRDSEERIAAQEERIMMEAEALNDAALAEMEDDV
jgi:pre-mRNA-splicing factor CDC5/CEF1